MTSPTSDAITLGDFMARVQQASRTGSKEIRVPINVCVELAAAIGQLMARNIEANERLRETERLIAAGMRIDGGKLG